MSEGSQSQDEDTQHQGSITLIGTTNRRDENTDEIVKTIEDKNPDVVAVELDEARYDRLRGETDEEVDASDVVSGKTGYQFLGQWLLDDVERRFSGHFADRPGSSVTATVDTANEQNATVEPVDRDLGDTTQRLWSGLGFRQKFAVLSALTADFGGPWKAGLGLGLFWGLLFGAIGSMLAGPFLVPAGTGTDLGLPLMGPLLATLDAVVVIVALGLAFGVPLALALARGKRSFEATPVTVDQLRDTDPVTAIVEGCFRQSPARQRLLEERDAYIAHRLLELQGGGNDIVAVVGAGRREQLTSLLDAPEELPSRERVSGPVESNRLRSALYRGIGYAFTVGFLLLFVLLALGGTQDRFLLELFAAWFVVNFVAAAGAAFLTGAHWTSASAGGAVAWLTSVNPMITPGLFIAYVELRYTPVKLSDVWRMKELLGSRSRPLLERLRRTHADIGLFRLLVIMTVANLASFVASVLFVALLLPYLATDVGGLGALGDELVDGIHNGARILIDGLG